MNIRKIPVMILALGLLLSMSIWSAAADLPDFVQLAQQNKPAVVNISTAKTITQRQLPNMGPGTPFDEFFNRFFNGHPNAPHKQRSLGSGFIISQDGYILTNEHVVDGADEITVKLGDGRTFQATVKGADQKLDLALLKVEAKGDLPVASFGDSDELKIGEWVMAIGNPFGLEQTVTAGIVSAKGRVIGAGPYDDFIQTDASINPGNSGGPLFNSAGQVVGINTAIVAGGQGIGFAIPINAVKEILQQLRTSGHVTRGWLGVSIQQMTPDLAKSFGLEDNRGALVAEVIKDSPAEQAGLQRGDVILTFDGHEVNDMHDLPRLVAATPVDKLVKLQVLRDGKTRDVKIKIGKLAEDSSGTPSTAGESEHDRLGLSLQNLDNATAQQLGIDANTAGVLVTAVKPDSPAGDAGVQPGDLIMEVNGRQTEDLQAFQKATADTPKSGLFRLLVKRQDNLLFIALKLS
ncbi:MAG: DegQ family serine endoprotease [Desulfuromonadales bacterium]